MHLPDDLTEHLYAFGIVVFGALAHATNQFKLARSCKKDFTLLDFLILLPLSVFSGGMFGFVASLLSENMIHLYIACGTGSFLGIAGLNALTERVLKFMTSNYERNNK
jgi:hypothetical protein